MDLFTYASNNCKINKDYNFDSIQIYTIRSTFFYILLDARVTPT